jgi:predicted nicotinamide N-methyase
MACFMRRGGAAGSDAADAAEAPPPLAGARVLELGCGHGLPGVLAALSGASEVAFQDYNEEVLHALTGPNVAANLARTAASASVSADAAPQRAPPTLRFFAGDWGRLMDVLPAGAYDLILTSDTIYSPATQPRLLRLLARCLRPGGCALVAAKSYYFGVGGGAADFAAAVAADGALSVRTVARFRDGASNVREIMRLEHAAAADA